VTHDYRHRLAERDRFADGRAYVGAQRRAAERDIYDLAVARLPGGKNELMQGMAAGQPRARAHACRSDFATLDEVGDHLSETSTLCFGETESDAQAKPVMPHDLSFEAAKSVNIKNSERSNCGRARRFEASAVRREIADDALFFPLALREEDLSLDTDGCALARAPFATGETEAVLVSIR